MIGKIEYWSDAWRGLSIGITVQEIDHLISQLETLRADAEQHFHISCIPDVAAIINDIEIYVKSEHEPDNLRLSSFAVGPGQGQI